MLMATNSESPSPPSPVPGGPSVLAGVTPEGVERRRFPRRPIALDVAFGPMRDKACPPEGTLRQTVTVDISTGGMCLCSDQLHPVGTELWCLVRLPGRLKPIETVTTVVWFQKVPREEHSYKLGVEFVTIAQADRAAIERIVQEPPTSGPAKKHRLLLVEDDEELSQALKVRFESAGYQVGTAAEGLEALTLCRAQPPHLIILDLMLPRLSGYEVCRLLKFDQKFQHIPIVVLTGRSREEDRELGLSMGASAYVTKPFDGNQLLETVDHLLTQASHARS